MVFAPMVTSQDYLPNARQVPSSRPVVNGLMVNLGWVPLDKKKEISTEPPVEAFEFTDKDFNYSNGRKNAYYIIFDYFLIIFDYF